MSCATEKAAFWQSKYPLTATKSSLPLRHRHERPLCARTRREGCLRKRFRAAQEAQRSRESGKGSGAGVGTFPAPLPVWLGPARHANSDHTPRSEEATPGIRRTSRRRFHGGAWTARRTIWFWVVGLGVVGIVIVWQVAHGIFVQRLNVPGVGDVSFTPPNAGNKIETTGEGNRAAVTGTNKYRTAERRRQYGDFWGRPGGLWQGARAGRRTRRADAARQRKRVPTVRSGDKSKVDVSGARVLNLATHAFNPCAQLSPAMEQREDRRGLINRLFRSQEGNCKSRDLQSPFPRCDLPHPLDASPPR